MAEMDCYGVVLVTFQVMASDAHRFLSSSLYSSGTLVAWDPAPFSADLTQVTLWIDCRNIRAASFPTFFYFFFFLHFLSLCFCILQWYNRTDYPIFTQYQRYRMLHPMQPFYILHPRFEWQVWQQIQDNMAEPIQKNPPSSGLLGACQVVRVSWPRLFPNLKNCLINRRRMQGTTQSLFTN